MGAKDAALPHGWHRQSLLLLLLLLSHLLLLFLSLPHFISAQLRIPHAWRRVFLCVGETQKLTDEQQSEVAEEKGNSRKGKWRRGERGGGLQVYRRESIQIQAIYFCAFGIP